eukprot:CAMPEP_0194209342 /NCGR_PEP_ID=MMETSP0156-20130528/7503_1 /TAXON_ID=33649 /ORGANISM="Thalassionema nitzschioides, Strain L26-B" /LENGTH=323 /DNA_ID=CAMNT_0038936497 /DNA_START=39 /DNA_END=1010 /DNA_ORIENTATION=+
MTPPPAAAEAPSPSPSDHQYPTAFSEQEIHDILGAVQEPEEHHSSTETDYHLQPVKAEKGREQEPTPGFEIASEARAKARSERKRSREKQRREDVNKQFADLSQLLREIEAEDLTEEGCSRLPIVSGGPTNRVDLIGRTMVVLERIHKINKDRKNEIKELTKELEDAKKMAEDTAARLKEATLYQQPQKQVMMMVPMMISPDGTTTNGFSGGMGPQAFMPQMPMMMPQMQQMAPAPTPSPASVTPSQSTVNSMVMPQMQQMMPQMQQMMQAFNPMFAQQSANSMVPAPQPSQGSSNPQQQAQQPNAGKQAPSNNVGGNLAHCA